MKKQLLIVGNNASAEIAEAFHAVCNITARPQISIGKFSSGEPFVELFPKDQAHYAPNSALLKDSHIIIVQSTGAPVSDNYQHLLLMAHTAKLYGAAEVTAVMPFAAFARQDRTFKERFTSVAGDLFPKLLKASGVDSVMTVTPHSQAAIKFYRDVFGDDFMPLQATDLFAADIRKNLGADASALRLGAPDGAEKAQDEGQMRARELAKAVFNQAAEDPKAMFRISKVHTDVSDTKIVSFDGDVAGKDCVIVDDMIDGGSTMINAASLLKAQGAKSVSCYATHGILSGDALEKILSAKPGGIRGAIDRLVVTDTIPGVTDKVAELAKTHPALARFVEVLPVGPMMASAYRQKHGLKPV